MAVDSEDSEKKYATYDPDSRLDFLSRLQTFKLVSYSSKPPQIDAVAAARCGWFNEGTLVLRVSRFGTQPCHRERKIGVQDMQSRLDHASETDLQ